MKRYEVLADYYQFYILDRDVDPEVWPSLWTNPKALSRLATAEGTVSVRTARNVIVPVEVHSLNDPPTDIDISAFDYIAECSINVPSGQIVVMGCTEDLDTAESVHASGGQYRVRICCKNLNTVRGLEGNDSYHVYIWPGPEVEPFVLKDYAGS